MKKTLTRTIIVFVAVNLMTAGFALAQNVPDEGIRDTIAAQAAEEADFAQKQMEAAQEEMETKEKKLQVQLKQLLTAQKQMEPEIMMMEMATPVSPRVSIPGWQYSGIGSILVIPAAQMKVEDLAAITEDMAVMSRIFAKKLTQAQLITGGSLFGKIESLSFGRGYGAIEAIYLDGYGALFLTKVNLLLSPSPLKEQEEKKTEEEDTDPLWTQMRQEMYAPEEARRRRTARPEEKYDAEKVAEFRETLIKTLKHAANIRTLKPDESVILSVTGKAGQSGTRTTTRSYGPGLALSDRRSGRSYNITIKPGGAETGFSSPTVLTIRAKKSDIDAFAKGQLSFDQFHQKTQLISYPYLGENVGGPSQSSPTNIIYGGSSSRRSRR